MLSFQLFRVMVRLPEQTSYLYPDRRPDSILRELLSERPSAELRKGHVWHIGNVEEIADTGVYFALGRITSSIVERWDEEHGKFIEEQDETAPYTHVLFDLRLQVCAIAAKSRLSPTVRGIGRQLARLLNTSGVAREMGARIEVVELNDPEDFIGHLRGAYAVTRFWLTVSLPNPWDVEQDFHRPMQQCLQAAHGQEGRTQLSGPSLNTEVLEALTRSAAAAGDEAGADIMVRADGPSVKRRLSGNAVTIGRESLSTPEQKASLLDQLRETYERVRHAAETEGN